MATTNKKPEQQKQQEPEVDEGLVKVNFSREFKFWDGEKVNVYQKGENEVTKECAQWAADSDAIVKGKD